MVIFNIILKDVKQSFRNKKELLLMILFPIVLMTILGGALSKAMQGDGNLTLDKVKVLYAVQGENSNLSQAFSGLKTGLKEQNVEFKEIKDIKQGKESLQNMDYSCFVVVDEKNNAIDLFKNEKQGIDAGLIEGILNTFVEKYNLVSEVGKINPAMVPEVLKESNDKHIELQSLNSKMEPRAIDYYGVAMTSLIILYSAMTGGFGIIGERTRKTDRRMYVSPISKKQIFLGKTVAAVIITIMEILIVVLFSKYILKVNWGNDMFAVAGIFITEILMAVSMGVCTAMIIKSEAGFNGIINLIITVMVFLGGGYVPIEVFKSNVLDKLSEISPIKWINDSIINIVFSGNYSKVSTTITINLIMVVIFLTIASMCFKREEA